VTSYRKHPWDQGAFDDAQLSLRGGLGLELIQRGQNLSKVRWSDARDQQIVRDVQSSLRHFLSRNSDQARVISTPESIWRARLGVAQSIDSISDDYGDVKVALMQPLCQALEDYTCYELQSVAGALEVLTRKPQYLQKSPELKQKLIGAAISGGADLSEVRWPPSPDMRDVLKILHYPLLHSWPEHADEHRLDQRPVSGSESGADAPALRQSGRAQRS